jgi:hypothetical protein
VVDDACLCVLSVQEDGFEYIDRVLLLSFGGGEYGEVYGKSLCARQGSAAETDLPEYDRAKGVTSRQERKGSRLDIIQYSVDNVFCFV